MTAITETADNSFERHQVEFTGNWREYFGIWIVNILLTILTLGIYSAWAKVRRKRWFYGHTFIAGSSFDYHGRPVQILIGRIIVLVLFAAYNLAVNFAPMLGVVIAAGLLFAAPWFIARGLRFNARVTSWRNMRFDFTGGYWGAWPGFVLGPMLAYSTLGVLAPLASKWSWSYVFGKAEFAGKPVLCDPDTGKLFRQLWPALGAVFLGAIVLVGIVAVVFMTADTTGMLPGGEDGPPPVWLLAILYFIFVPFFLLFALAGLVYSAGVRNVVYNATVIDGRHLLESKVGRRRFAAIAVTNFLATLLTLGLARPWAAVRMAKYLASATALHVTGSLDAYQSKPEDEGGAAGAEYMDVEGFDVGF